MGADLTVEDMASAIVGRLFNSEFAKIARERDWAEWKDAMTAAQAVADAMTEAKDGQGN